MASELCKVALWLEALEPGKPLTFLDHHIKTGNSVVGAEPTQPLEALVNQGIPDEAYAPLEGDDKKLARAVRDRNRKERAGERGLFSLAPGEALAAVLRRIDETPEDDIADVRAKERTYAEVSTSYEFHRGRAIADAWTAAFHWPKTRAAPRPITTADLHTIQSGGRLSQDRESQLNHIARQLRPFHWRIEFPDVFVRENPGFDLVLGNPPWDSLSPDQREFFGRYHSRIRSLSPNEQREVIATLLENEAIAEAWNEHRRALFRLVHFLKNSGRFTLYAPGNLGKGDFNLYRPFAEFALTAIRQGGYAAQVMPGGMYGGANASAIRHFMFDKCSLTHIWGLINTSRGWFEEVDMDRFCAYTAKGGGFTEEFQAMFGLANPGDLTSPPVSVQGDLIRRLAPETYAIPDIRSTSELVVAEKMYERHPLFGDESARPPYRRYMREIDMGTDRGLFTTASTGLPVYEGRMIDQYDHRAKVYVSGHGNSAVWNPLPFGDPGKAISPQWRIEEEAIPGKLDGRERRFRLGFADIANPRNARSFVAALIPPFTVCGHTVPTITFDEDYEWAYLPWLAVANSYTMDALTRKKLSSPHLTLSVMDGLPFPRPLLEDTWVQRVSTLVLRLTCTTPDMAPYWNRMARLGLCQETSPNSTPQDALIDQTARSDAMAEIDAIVARDVYGLTREEIADVLETFPIIRRRDEQAYGTFLTKNSILRAYDELAQGNASEHETHAPTRVEPECQD